MAKVAATITTVMTLSSRNESTMHTFATHGARTFIYPSLFPCVVICEQIIRDTIFSFVQISSRSRSPLGCTRVRIMHAQQAMISLCVFVFLSHLHKLRYNTFILDTVIVVVAVARFFSSHYSSSSSQSPWILSSYLLSSTHLFIQYLCYTVCLFPRSHGRSFVCIFILQFINSVGSNSSRRSNSNRKCSNHPFIAYSNSYRCNQTK